MWDVFKSLLRKATLPVNTGNQPTPVVPADKPKILDTDRSNHVNKIHYTKPHEANIVVQRSKFQEPKRNKNLHYYSCPVCEHEHGTKKYIVGHDPTTTRHDQAN